jgi:F-type H+-transporting ATPase subunit epsilon
MATFPFELVSPERLLVSEQVEEVVAPGTEGEFGVLAGHAPFLSTLKPGIVTVKLPGGALRKLFVRGGFAEVNASGLTILAEQAIPLEDLDAAHIDAEIRDAETDVADATGEEARHRAQQQLDRLRELKAALASGAAATHH